MELGATLVDFSLPATDGTVYTPASLASAAALVVVQMCNHCPYVVAYQDRMDQLALEFAPRGAAFVGVNSNDAAAYPQDDLPHMRQRVADVGMPFPYLHDEDQSVARALGSVRTPEFFLFDRARKLVYHGRFDDNLESPRGVTAHYLRDALEATLAGRPVDVPETPTIGCTVKWKG